MPALGILIVEDDPIQGMLLSRLLEREPGLAVRGWARDGAEGVELALAEEPDAILLDLILPTLSGLGFLEEYRRRGGRAGTLVLTGATSSAAASAAMAAGAGLVLHKPAPLGEIVRCLRLLCGGVRARAEALLDEMETGVAPFTGRTLAGRGYAARCAETLLLRPGESVKGLYYQIVEEDRVSAESVERSIRFYVEKLFLADTPKWREVMGPLAGGSRPPSNGKFLSALAQAVKIPL